ncbi:MAG: TolC family outer membrane protein [Hyphomicrobiaceae bacterium]|nr:TolC family outer membrane protein [Hyphomicrobiaceae bacterium]
MMRPARIGVVRAAIFAAGLLLGTAPQALTVSAESLRDVAAAAYKYNPRLDAERARQRATDEEVARAHSGYRPTVSGTADIGYNRTDTKPEAAGAAGGGGGETHPKGYGVSASQPIFRGFRTLNGVRVAEATVRAGRETLRNVEQSVLLEAATAYMDVVRDQAIVKLRENNVDVLTRELKATRDRFSVGEVTRTDVAQAEARRAAAVSTLDLARSNLKSSRANFERTVGYPPGALSDQQPPNKLLPKSLTEAIDITMREAPTIVASIYTEQAARHNVDLIWGELLPTVRLDASYTHRYDTSRTVDETETSTVRGVLDVPLYEAGDTRARVRAAKHTHVSRLQQVEQARTEAKAATTTAWSVLTAARAQLESDQVQVSATRTALAGVREEERVGQRTLLDVLNAEQEALNAQVSLVTTKRNLVVAAYTLMSAIGRLSIAELGAAALAYDVEAHYHEVRRKWWGISITHRDGRSERVDLWETYGTRHESMK